MAAQISSAASERDLPFVSKYAADPNATANTTSSTIEAKDSQEKIVNEFFEGSLGG